MQHSLPRIAVVGSINMDLVIQCDRIARPSETVLAQSVDEVCGGKGANQAVAAAKAGASVRLIGRVGSDAYAGRLLAGLQDHHIDLAAVSASKDCSSGLAVISVDQSGQNAITVVPGANHEVTVADIQKSRSIIASSDLLMVQLELPVEVVVEAIRIARGAGVRVMLDPAPVPAAWPDELLKVDLLCPNETEAAALVGFAVDSQSTAELAARQLVKCGVMNVAVTMGDQGTLLLHDDKAVLVPAYSINAVDTTAAGDAFAGALAVQWMQTDDLIGATRFANAAGALAASHRGAQPSMATRQAIDELWATT